MARQGRDSQRFGADSARLVAGCVPLLNGKVVLVCNRKNRNKWGLPKGGWEDDEPTACEAALREAFEEAGVRCVPGASLADTRVEPKAGVNKPVVQVHWFACYVTELVDQWPEAAERDRQVVSLDEALELVTRPEQKAALLEVKARGLDVLQVSSTTSEAFSRSQLILGASAVVVAFASLSAWCTRQR